MMLAMTETRTPAHPALTRDAIMQSFLADAQANTEAVVEITEKLQALETLKGELERIYGEATAAYAGAKRRPNVLAKLRELGVQDPALMRFELGRTSSRRSAGRKTSRSRAAKDRATVSQRTAGAQTMASDADGPAPTLGTV